MGEVRDWEFGSAPCGWCSASGCGPRRGCAARAPGSWKRSAPRSAAAACRRCARCSRATTRWYSRSSAARDDGRPHRAGTRPLKLQKNTMLALCGVLEFAAQPGRQLSAAEIAGKYGASPHHLAKVLGRLRRAPGEGGARLRRRLPLQRQREARHAARRDRGVRDRGAEGAARAAARARARRGPGARRDRRDRAPRSARSPSRRC